MDLNGFAFEFEAETRTFARRHYAIPPELEPGQVLIRVTCCTICGSDLHTYCGRRSAPPSCVLGHEIIGEIVKWNLATPPVDFHGNQLSKGHRVTWVMATGCGNCFFCQNQLPQKCERIFKYGHERGSEIPTGGLSQFCVLVPGTSLFVIPESMPDEVACPANCATATVAAAIRTVAETHRLAGCKALITGAGMLGLTAAAQLADAGAGQIVITDLDEKRLESAKRFGATQVIQSDDQQKFDSIVNRITENRGFDVALDFAGVTNAVETCLQNTRTGGAVLLAGSVFPMNAISISPETLVRRLLTIRGLHNYRPSDLDHALQFLDRTRSQFPFHELVSKFFPLEQTPEAFRFAVDERPVRVGIQPNSEVAN